jgi:hypothetical protein
MTFVRRIAVALLAAVTLLAAAPLEADTAPADSGIQWGPAQSQPAPAQPSANQPASAPSPAQAAPAPAESAPAQQPAGDVGPQTYSMDETLGAAQKFFGGTSEGLAKAIEKAFHDLGAPNAYIQGSEGSGAFIVGLRYGEGQLFYKGGGNTKLYWQGPSVGFDWGGNASKVFTLIYNLHWTRDIYQRFPGVDGSLYLVAGVGLNYQRASEITLAPIRTGVGLRAGASVGYLAYTQKQSWIPF